MKVGCVSISGEKKEEVTPLIVLDYTAEERTATIETDKATEETDTATEEMDAALEEKDTPNVSFRPVVEVLPTAASGKEATGEKDAADKDEATVEEAVTVAKQEDIEPPDIPIHKTKPWVSVWILSLTEISPNTSSFRARFEFNVFWCLSDKDTKSYKDAIRENSITEWDPTWKPNFLPVNVASVESMDREVFANGKDFVIIKQKDGTLAGRYVLLLDAVFTELFELRLFPYEVQDLTMDIQYHSYPQAYQPLMAGSGDIDLAKSNIKIHEKCMSSPEWILHSVQLGFGVWKQQLRINVKIERRWQYYVYRVFFVLGMITLISCFTSFIPSETLDGQLGYLSTCLLASVAYLYVVGEALPKLPFLTMLDVYTYICILFVGVLMVKSCILAHLGIGNENKRQIIVIFCADLIAWIIIHILFIIRAFVAKCQAKSALWTFPETLVFKANSEDNTLGYGGKQPPGGCVAYLDNECKRMDFDAQGKEVYQKLLPADYANIINM